MASTFISYNNIVSPLGYTSNDVFQKIREGKDGISSNKDLSPFSEPVYVGRISPQTLDERFGSGHNDQGYTKLEKMMILALAEVIDNAEVELGSETILIISTTKGNIDCLEPNSIYNKEKAYLSVLARTIGNYFGFENTPLIISNACVSGLLSVSVARRLLDYGLYKHAFIVSGDVLSRFILSGFKSFQAISKGKCRPYSKYRDGITIGEAAASVFITQDENKLSKEAVEIKGDASVNDANHISGPSRTGEGLYRAVSKAMQQAKMNISDLDYISAHGTATIFNDEMEAVAFNRLKMQHIPLNSLKGYFGHTMGACGLLETIIGMHMLKNNILIKTKGFDEIGVSQPLTIIKENRSYELSSFLKTSSGFGGSNTAILYKSVNLL